MNYIKVQFDDGTIAFQEVSRGQVMRYCDDAGATLNLSGGCSVIDPTPEQPAWALADPVLTDQSTPESRVISKLQYMNKFHDDELAGIFGTAKVSLAVEIWLEKFHLAEFINLDDPTLLYGLQALEAAGLIGSGRAVEIIT